TLHALGSGTDRNSVWLLAIVAVLIGLVATLAIRSIVEQRVRRRAFTTLVPLVTGLLLATAGVGLAEGPFRVGQPPDDTFTDALTGHIQRQFGAKTGFISFAGRGVGTQVVLVRLDLLVTPTELVASRFQMEYLSNGVICIGRVKAIDAYGFSARCTFG